MSRVPMRARVVAAEASPGAATALRVALLTNENTPYRVPLYRELARTPGWTFQVFNCVDREVDRLWDVTPADGFASKRSLSFSYLRRQTFGGDRARQFTTQVHLPVGVVPDVLAFRPDVVLSNEFGLRTLLATVTRKIGGHSLIVYNEATCHTERHVGRVQRFIRRRLARRAYAFICNGRDSRAYLEHLGVLPSEIFESGQALDVESFGLPKQREARPAVRRRYGIDGVGFLYAGQIIALKGINELLTAWGAWCRMSSVEATLVLAGDGEQRRAAEATVSRLGLANVRFLGFVPRQELAEVCAACDVFVFPTLRDCFSLAFEEAMASGLPAIGSIYGGESELIDHGVNGWICDPLNAGQLTAALAVAYAAKAQLPDMGGRARQAVARMAVHEVAARIRHAVEYVACRAALPVRAAPTA